MEQGGGEVVEEASPISSRPPANLEELMRFSGPEDAGGGGGGAGGGGGGSSSSGGNRWPREETLALLRIRSDMDCAFRDATLKAPLWEDVSRKLGELGYKRSAKKCKEKFENVQKYYKRTKEGKGGRNDGKAYKFFSELEALNTAAAAAAASSSAPPPPPPPSSATLDVTPLSVANPPPQHQHQHQHQYHQRYHQQHHQQYQQPQSQLQLQQQPQPRPQQPSSTTIPFGGTLSSHSSSTASSMGYEDDDDNDEDDNMHVDPDSTAAGTSSRKRKRTTKEHGRRKMMEFFEGLMRQVLQKQATMQRSFLEALEKREQERLTREEAWKRQETSRLAREHELMAQERAASASRDAAIVSLIQKITGHTIHLPPSLTVSSAPPQTSLSPSPPPPPPPPPQPLQQQIPLQQQRSQVSTEAARHQTSSFPSQSQPIMAIPEQQIPPPQPQPQPQPQKVEKQHDIDERGGSSEPGSSSRWPKSEVYTLINLRSGMESKYQEVGPKGPLWEEISGGMKRLGYNRSAKRCKEKWENINKYYKKIKESNKKRPEDAKTCPYFHQLEALYQNKVLGSSSSSTQQHPKESSEVDPVSASRPFAEATRASPSIYENKDEEHAKERSPGTTEKPEDIVRELMQHQQVVMSEYDEKMEEEDEDAEEEPEEAEAEAEGYDDMEDKDDQKNMANYDMEFQQRENGPNRGGNGAAPSFLTMVQ